MKRTGMKRILIAIVILVSLTLAVSAGGQGEKGASSSAGKTTPIKVGHLSYHTGAFADVGPHFDYLTNFILEIINQDPPLGRKMVGVHQDIGTIGEAQAARKLLENEGCEVLLNPAHEYGSYRDWLLGYLKQKDTPLMPSVHGGSIEESIGGIPTEPIFRGQPMDSSQAVAGILQLYNIGVRKLALVSTEIAGSQLMGNAANNAAKKLGMEIVLKLDVQPEQTSYRTEVKRIIDSKPEGVFLASQAQDGGTIVKQLAEDGASLYLVGSSEWLGTAFVESATISAIKQHKAVWATGFSNATTPAWDFYKPLWEKSSEGLKFAQPENSYNIAYYDVLVVTALAIEAAGSTKASAWAPMVFKVANGPGKKVYTYKDGLAAIRAGEDIDYSGISGEFDYTPTGVPSGDFAVYEWTSPTELKESAKLDGKKVLELTH